MPRISETPVGAPPAGAPARTDAERDGGGAAGAAGVDGEQVCRICLVGAADTEAGGLREPLVHLACACKGGLRLVHARCADEWFAQRGAWAPATLTAPPTLFHSRLGVPFTGSQVCEICRSGPAWQPSAAALQTAARRAAAARVANPLYVPGTGAQAADPVLFSGGSAGPNMHTLDPQHAARLRLMLSDICVLLALLLLLCLETLVHRLHFHNASTILLLFVSFCASAVFVSVARWRLLAWLKWADSRLGAAVLTMGTIVLAIFFLTRQGLW